MRLPTFFRVRTAMVATLHGSPRPLDHPQVFVPGIEEPMVFAQEGARGRDDGHGAGHRRTPLARTTGPKFRPRGGILRPALPCLTIAAPWPMIAPTG